MKRLRKISQTKQEEEIERGLELGLEAAPSINDRSISLFSRGHLPAFAGINTFMKAPYCEDIKKVGNYEAAFVGIFPHLMGSAINNAAFAHFAAAIPNYVLMESNLMAGTPDIVDEQMPIENGYRIVSDRPGIGIEINEAALAKYPQKKVAISGFFHADGSVAH